MRRLRYLLLATLSLPLAAPAEEARNFLLLGQGEVDQYAHLLQRPDIDGVQIIYTWRQLEPQKGQYDFSSIEQDLVRVSALHKQLFIQIQDRFFTKEARRVPNYLLAGNGYGGGLVAQSDDDPGEGPQTQGWVARQWNPNVRERYQQLLQALAKAFDGRVEGINLPETAIGVDDKHDKAFTCDKYFAAELENMLFARKVFKQSTVVQYVNFWPCEWDNDHRYMERLFDAAFKHGVGLGGPDIVPYRKAQMHNSYPFFHRYKDRLALIAMAVQEPTLTYRDPNTGKHFTREQFDDFGRNYLGASIIFWTTSSPWLLQ
ncbi:hypothetical protein [Dyella flagellata]|uniref:Uncharacterized protein n=1 Tax=Dyella flagellata TaxID=1867833 RepID=A0ABQ5XIU8_9GAMM|nr:hypothetical protein [Dyella flagellata]GLQ90394.1 hypothetical protein GCM10007898_39690 [Dyella flagellata]